MKAILFDKYGDPSVMYIGEAPKPIIDENEVLIKVAAAGINRPDILQRQGGYPPPKGASEILVLEVSGKIVEIGKNIDLDFKGKEVCALVTGGGYAEYVKTTLATVLPIPKGLNVVDAAAIPETFFTVWTNLFNSGLRPAINVGISVSRVGGAAQTKAIKKIAGTLKLELAQFDELAAFSQFASDLDEATQKQLGRGKRLRELLKQPQFDPLNLAEQVAVVYAGVKGLIDEVPEEEVTKFARELRDYLKTNKADFIKNVLSEKVLSEASESMLKDAINEVKSSMLAA